MPDCLMTDRELTELVKLAQNRRVLELGTWRGRGTAAMAKHAIIVWTVDHHRGDDFCGYDDTLPAYLQHLEERGLCNRVVTVVGGFGYVLPGLAMGRFDLVVVDGSHTPHDVEWDAQWALALVTPTGHVAFHDWTRHGVDRIVTGMVGEPTYVVEELAVYERLNTR